MLFLHNLFSFFFVLDYMDSSLDCGYIGVHFIGRGQSITVRAKTKDASTSTQVSYSN
jgi:hypothetical protein